MARSTWPGLYLGVTESCEISSANSRSELTAVADSNGPSAFIVSATIAAGFTRGCSAPACRFDAGAPARRRAWGTRPSTALFRANWMFKLRSPPSMRSHVVMISPSLSRGHLLARHVLSPSALSQPGFGRSHISELAAYESRSPEVAPVLPCVDSRQDTGSPPAPVAASVPEWPRGDSNSQSLRIAEPCLPIPPRGRGA